MTLPVANRAWRVVAASVAGRHNKESFQSGQDAYCSNQVDPDVLIAAVADGAGSADCSALGSSLAVRAAVIQATRQLSAGVPAGGEEWGALLLKTFRAAHVEVANEAEKLDISPAAFATTLTVALATSGWLAVGQIGDGSVVARLPDDSLQSMTSTADQEYINETTFLTSPLFSESVQLNVQPGAFTGLALFTDGLQRLALKMPQGTPHPTFFSPLLALLATTPTGEATRHLQGFLQSPRVAEKAEDDLTLLLAIRK